MLPAGKKSTFVEVAGVLDRREGDLLLEYHSIDTH